MRHASGGGTATVRQGDSETLRAELNAEELEYYRSSFKLWSNGGVPGGESGASGDASGGGGGSGVANGGEEGTISRTEFLEVMRSVSER